MLDNVHSLASFTPELVLAATVLVVLTLDLVVGRLRHGWVTALSLAGVAAAAWATLATAGAPRGLFFGLIARDPFADFFKLLFLATAALIALVALRAGDSIAESAAEFYALLLTTTIGMMLMAAARDLLLAYLSLEMVSIMSYVLAGFGGRRRGSAEAALKYVVYGGVASGVMLYGMSLLYGLAGATSFGAILQAAGSTPSAATVLLAVVLCLAGFGYKVAAVPFHMWCPDVYEGAPTVVSAFLAVGPKAAGFALLLRFCGGVLPAELAGAPAPWPLLFGLVAVATMTLGNLAALGQTNVKRLLAYSSIAHAGYLLLALVAGGREGVGAVLIYLVAYLFMTLGPFVVVMVVGDELAAWRGFGRRAPFAAATMTIFLLALTGLPPLSGFFAKFTVFYALVARGGSFMTALAVAGVLNSALSVYYYARILKTMYFEGSLDEGALPVSRLETTLLAVLAAPTVALCAVWQPLARFVDVSLRQW